jgi:hypothetical protein
MKHWELCGQLECRRVEGMLADYVDVRGHHPSEHGRQGGRHPWSGWRRRAARHNQRRARINRSCDRDQLHAWNL